MLRPCVCSARTTRTRASTRRTLQFEQELATDLSLYFDFTHAKGVHLTRFLNLNRTSALFAPTLGEMCLSPAPSASRSIDGFTVGMRKRFSKRYQFEWNYVLCERYGRRFKRARSIYRSFVSIRSISALTMRSPIATSVTSLTSSSSVELPWGFEGNFRVQGTDGATNHARGAHGDEPQYARKDNEYFSFDWRLQRPFKFGERYALIPIIEMFNTFNNANNINPLTGAALFNFDGFLRAGVGDPRQLQLAIKFTF